MHPIDNNNVVDNNLTFYGVISKKGKDKGKFCFATMQANGKLYKWNQSTCYLAQGYLLNILEDVVIL